MRRVAVHLGGRQPVRLRHGPLADPHARHAAILLAAGQRSFSFEFFPPKDDAARGRPLGRAARLEPLHPSFVSVTYGAGGSTREGTVALTERIATTRP